jgi:hypothetical protein
VAQNTTYTTLIVWTKHLHTVTGRGQTFSSLAISSNVISDIPIYKKIKKKTFFGMHTKFLLAGIKAQ